MIMYVSLVQVTGNVPLTGVLNLLHNSFTDNPNPFESFMIADTSNFLAD